MKRDRINFIAGVDEAGRGPLAGPVCASCVLLKEHHGIVGLTDSKKLSEKKRKELYQGIIKNSISYYISMVNQKRIDRINIREATKLCMKICMIRVFKLLTKEYGEDFSIRFLIDGNMITQINNHLPKERVAEEAIVKGDLKVEVISASSILAKVFRDRYMEKMDKKYPEYKFFKHKGYPTKLHREKIKEFGVSPIHRVSFKGVREYV